MARPSFKTKMSLDIAYTVRRGLRQIGPAEAEKTFRAAIDWHIKPLACPTL